MIASEALDALKSARTGCPAHTRHLMIHIKSGDAEIAYHVLGSGPPLVSAPSLSLPIMNSGCLRRRR